MHAMVEFDDIGFVNHGSSALIFITFYSYV